MRNKAKYDLVLFAILAVLAFLPMLQGWFQWFPMKPLNGVTETTEKPAFAFDAYRSGAYAKEAETYTRQHFGFREPIIRLYNQYLWNCYHKTYANDVVAGKKGWLYYPQSVKDYYGTELLKWHSSVDEAKKAFDMEVKYMNWTRSILKENGVELLVFMAPEKSFLYPEFLPDGKKVITNFNACEYFAQRFKETNFPCIEMTPWFQQMKDTVDYPLIPQMGAHWIFSSVYAVDSLLRLMGELKGITLPKIKIGETYESRDHDFDNDLELLLNLAFPLRHSFGYIPRSRVSIECDSTAVKPKVLFIGNSYFWSMRLFTPFPEMFEKTEFWYYFSTAYSGDSLTHTENISHLDLVEKLLDFDYVVWFTTGNQMNKGTTEFAETTLLNLCFDKEQIVEVHNKLIDSLMHDRLTLTTLGKPVTDSSLRLMLWPIANHLIYTHPERYFSELVSDSLPIVRNPKIKEVLAIKEIKKDSVWMWNLSSCQTVIQNAPLDQVLLMEAYNIIDGRPLLRDMPDVETKRDRVEQLVAKMIQEIYSNSYLMQQIQEKAQKTGLTLEEQIHTDARWMVHYQINNGIIAF